MSTASFRALTLSCAAALASCAQEDTGRKANVPTADTSPTEPTTDGTGTDTGDDSTTPTDTGTPPFQGTCPTSEQRTLLGNYLIEVLLRVPALAEHAMDTEPMTFLLLPGWDPTGVSFPILWVPCGGPLMMSESCDGTFCTLTECVEPGSSWIQHARLETAPTTDPAGLITYEATHSHVSWSDRAPGDIEVELEAIGRDNTGVDYTVSVEATHLWGDLDVLISWPHLLGTGEVVTAVATQSWGIMVGGIAVDGVFVADLVHDASGFSIVSNEACP